MFFQPAKKTACIIGGGFAGLSAAVFLDMLDFRVTLLEKKPVLGGRAYAFRDTKTASWIDNGQHLLMGAYHETFRFLESIGARHRLFIPNGMKVPIVLGNGKIDFFAPPPLPPPVNIMAGFWKMRSLTLSDKFHIIRLGRELMKLKKNGAKTPNQNVEDWLAGLGQSENIRKNFWTPLTLAVLNDNPKTASAQMLANVLIRGFLGKVASARLAFPKSNLNDLLANPAKAYLDWRRHEVRTGAGVEKIHVMDNIVRAVELKTGELIRSDYFISAVPFRALLNILPQNYVDTIPYFGRLKKLESSPIISINLWFDRDFLRHDFVGATDGKIHWYFNRNRLHGTQSSAFHYMGVISSAHALVNESAETLVKTALDELARFFPKSKTAVLKHSLVNKEREATLSQRPGEAHLRPAQKSPFKNFYVTGDWTATGYPATIESAVISARMAVEDLEKEINWKFSVGQTHPRFRPPIAQ